MKVLIPFLRFLPLMVALLMPFCVSRAQCVPEDLGKPHIQTYGLDDYEGSGHNAAFVQDKDGLIYAGNAAGLLEFDGERWRILYSPDLNFVTALAVDDHNTKWIASERELGYLAPDSLGVLRYRSLKDKIPSSHPLDTIIWDVLPTSDGVLFKADKVIYVWRDNEFHIIEVQGNIQLGFQIEGETFFWVKSTDSLARTGLYRIDGDSLRLVVPGERYQKLTFTCAMPHKGGILLGTMQGGLLQYDGESLSPFESEVNDYLIKNWLYRSLALQDGTCVLATLGGGILLMDGDGNLLRTYTKKDGLLSDQVFGMTLDNSRGLWVGHSTGISYIELDLPFTIFDETSGLKSRVIWIARHHDRLHVGTYQELYVKDECGLDGDLQFHRIKNGDGVHSVIILGRDLLIDNMKGVFLLSEDGNLHKMDIPGLVYKMLRSKRDPKRVFIGHAGGLSTLYLDNGKWKVGKPIDAITEAVFSITEDKEGALWLSTVLGEVIKVDYTLSSNQQAATTSIEALEITRHGRQQGLPKGKFAVHDLDGELIALKNPKKLGEPYHYDATKGTFIKDAYLNEHFGIDSRSLHLIAYQEEGDHSLLVSRSASGKEEVFSATRDQNTGKYSIKRVYQERFQNYLADGLVALWDKDGILWLGGYRGLIRYDLTKAPPIRPEPKVYVRQVTVEQDSLVLGGMSAFPERPVFPYWDNALRFQYATPSFGGRSVNEYRTKLLGFDTEWSPWSTETKKDYTNLPEGEYQFQVKARDVYGQVSGMDTFDFQIQPPWHRSWWAYLAYLLLGGLTLVGVASLRSRKLQRDKRRLQRIVLEKTAEIQGQAERLSYQTEQLKELDKAKSRFFANISHEFRTPLTLILGPLEQMSEKGDQVDQENIPVMRRNARRMQRLIDQLLSLSKIESGNLGLKVVEADVVEFLKPLVSSFSSHAEHLNIDYHADFSQENYHAYFDSDKLEKMVYNLLSNALKFTPGGGRVQVNVLIMDQWLHIVVTDTGQGIPKEELPFIFKRFHRTSQSQKNQQEGTGIGLALTKELAELHHGRVMVESQSGKGSTFTILLPMERSAYREEEIDQNPLPVSLAVPALVENGSGSEHLKEPSTTEEERPILLIVEDNEDLRRYIQRELCQHFQILQAVDGEEGVAMAIERVPDVIVSDLMMPKKDGIELCTILKTDQRTDHIPIVLLTAKASIESRLEGLATGADDYLTKPFHTEELVVRAQNLYQQRRRLKTRYGRIITLEPKNIEITSKSEVFLKSAMEVVEKHMGDPDFSTDDLGKEIGMSRVQLHRKLKALTGQTTTEFVRSQRLKRAADLLAEGSGNISEVGYQVGFSNLSYFARSFKEQYGVNPSEYIKANVPER